jgi:hypothetical protein
MLMEMTIEQLARTMCDHDYNLLDRNVLASIVHDDRMKVRLENIFRILHWEHEGRDTRWNSVVDLIDYKSDIYQLACDFNYMYLPVDFLEIRLRQPVEEWRHSLKVTMPNWTLMENPRSSELIYLKGRQRQWAELSELFPSFSHIEIRRWYIQIDAKKYVERIDYCDQRCKDFSVQTEPKLFS